MDIAKCVQIFKLEPDDDFVTKRESAIKNLRTQFLKNKPVSKLMVIGSGVCQVFRESLAMPDTLATQVEAAIKKYSSSFVRDDRDLRWACVRLWLLCYRSTTIPARRYGYGMVCLLRMF